MAPDGQIWLALVASSSNSLLAVANATLVPSAAAANSCG
ncbi:hypothetical protein MM1S1540310_2781 [Mycobacteroides abscessus subsp. bolletii 1S-154-0310]|nr:hypothetical protein MM1S1510930_3224 [Mycobacteroides abscessus subsp. bolletii 1S-151-0930]EIU70593.1 hypothetical protein MM1S1520914_3428 [Mycobacteroides abscessus subsp. bolletii 1S-152-0914]EIU73465.1 hypothetical protein MM1S1530915_2772 [Mycobacteroides abscessus subsp. bolletii 1S-153-0915]EIU80555.1 hypothetical protein MM1S1540310_2781 [Mycobacteroides abscessus subsp. bolletii 1S-154-0310]EIV03241.1 hypothetical protein MM2B0912R_3465 [Mycobacteroides abscessus subsp. bolletii 2